MSKPSRSSTITAHAGPGRQRPRLIRWVPAVVAALVGLMVSVTGPAAPAHADPDCGPPLLVDCDPLFDPDIVGLFFPRPGRSGFPVNLPFPTPQQKVAESMRVAMLVLAQPACNRLVSGANPHAGITAFDRLRRADVLIRQTPPPLISTVFADAPQASVVGSITVFSPFLRNFTFDEVRNAFANYQLTRTPSLVQLRATFLLHELGHLTNAQSHVVGDLNAPFNRSVLQECFGILSFAPYTPPTPPDRR